MCITMLICFGRHEIYTFVGLTTTSPCPPFPCSMFSLHVLLRVQCRLLNTAVTCRLCPLMHINGPMTDSPSVLHVVNLMQRNN